MGKITLYHGSLTPLVPNNNRQGIYLTPSLRVANEYLLKQADDATGTYGHIYTIEIDEERLVFTDNIDQRQKCPGHVLYSIDDEYYRIDDPESYNWRELTDEEIVL